MLNKHKLLMMGAALVLCGVSYAGAQQIQWLQYHTAREARNIVGDMGLQTLTLRPEKPPVIPLPDFTNEQPLFAQWASPMAIRATNPGGGKSICLRCCYRPEGHSGAKRHDLGSWFKSIYHHGYDG